MPGIFRCKEGKRSSAILGRGHLPLVAGGTGLYVQAVIDGFFEQPEYRVMFVRRSNSVWNRKGGMRCIVNSNRSIPAPPLRWMHQNTGE
jgi:tRNA A37 N6-isopentenylltransferase MiaA